MPSVVIAKVLNHPLKWAGGKRWLVPIVKSLWEQASCNRLVEPFCGGLAIALGLKPDQALLNDNNVHCVNFFRWVQKGLSVTISMENERTLFEEHRSRFNQLIEEGKHQTKEAAQLFYYLNRTGYNGLCRFNRSGEFNVPFGQRKKITYIRDFRDYQSLLASWHFMSDDFSKVSVCPSDFIYADPPYDVPFTQYTAFKFEWNDQVRLVEWLSEHKGPIVLSNQATVRIKKLYKEAGYQLHPIRGPRFISCTGDRTAALEVLATKNFDGGVRIHRIISEWNARFGFPATAK